MPEVPFSPTFPQDDMNFVLFACIGSGGSASSICSFYFLVRTRMDPLISACLSLRSMDNFPLLAAGLRGL
jgi:hypothetical protein